MKKFPLHILFIEIVSGIFASVGALLLFIKLRTEIIEPTLSTIDKVISLFMFGLRTDWLTNLAQLITHFGGRGLAPLTIIITIYLMAKKHTRKAIFLLIMFFSTTLLTMSLKSLIERPRPNIDPIVQEQTYSFPSGHATHALVFFSSLVYISYQIHRNKKTTAIHTFLAILVISVVGLSRIYLGVHYASDIAAGFILGFCWFVTLVVIEKTLSVYTVVKRNQQNRQR